MNYARPTLSPLISSRPVETKRQTSEHSRAVAEFCASHRVSLSVDPVTKQGVVKVTKDGE